MYFSRPVAGPGLHALVIGVGSYRHLPGGTGRELPDPLDFAGLGQLTSPPVSARRLAEWLSGASHELWRVPLASVDLLVTGGLVEPTIAAIRDAYAGWRDRAGGHQENVGLFYFCGHGLQAETRRMLLTADFGEHDQVPFLGAFDFEKTRDASVQTGPDTQCFFIDACAGSSAWLMRHSPSVEGLGTVANRIVGVAARHTVSILSALPFGSARGPIGGISYFTDALIQAFAGAAARLDDRLEWSVRTTSLIDAISTLMSRNPHARDHPPVQQNLFGDATLWTLPEPPAVDITLCCTPPDAQRMATLRCSPEPPSRPLVRLDHTELPWPVRSSAGSHLIEATFAEEQFAPYRKRLDLQPPGRPLELRIR